MPVDLNTCELAAVSASVVAVRTAFEYEEIRISFSPETAAWFRDLVLWHARRVGMRRCPGAIAS